MKIFWDGDSNSVWKLQFGSMYPSTDRNSWHAAPDLNKIYFKAPSVGWAVPKESTRYKHLGCRVNRNFRNFDNF